MNWSFRSIIIYFQFININIFTIICRSLPIAVQYFCSLLYMYIYMYIYESSKICINGILNLLLTKNCYIPFHSCHGGLEACGQFTPTMRQQCHLIYAMTSLRWFSLYNRRMRIITKTYNNKCTKIQKWVRPSLRKHTPLAARL